MKATTNQKKLIHINAPNREIKEEMVQSVTGDNTKKSCNDLDFKQANLILQKLGLKPHNYSAKPLFKKNDPKHNVILSLLHQANWVFEKNGQTFADVNRLNRFLTNDNRSPVKKKLIDLTPVELEKVIVCLNKIVSHSNK